jgi:hypothetical protein
VLKSKHVSGPDDVERSTRPPTPSQSSAEKDALSEEDAFKSKLDATPSRESKDESEDAQPLLTTTAPSMTTSAKQHINKDAIEDVQDTGTSPQGSTSKSSESAEKFSPPPSRSVPDKQHAHKQEDQTFQPKGLKHFHSSSATNDEGPVRTKDERPEKEPPEITRRSRNGLMTPDIQRWPAKETLDISHDTGTAPQNHAQDAERSRSRNVTNHTKPVRRPDVETPRISSTPEPATTTAWIVPQGKQCLASTFSSCSSMASSFGWEATCVSKSSYCDGCSRCHAMGTAQCPQSWLSFNGKCYRVNPAATDYYDARSWCATHKGKLVTIKSTRENIFVWRICHTEQDPIMYPSNSTRTSCWLGMREKPRTGNKLTPQDEQQWEWLDGSSAKDGYQNWALRPGMGDGDGDGNKYFEPNNERTKRSPLGYDVRHAVMNQPEGMMNGMWYDKPAAFRAHAVCEM